VAKLLSARPARDAVEEGKLRKLAGARHAPADWILRARIIVLSWDGHRVPVIAEQLGCHQKTVRRWLHRFNAEGPDGLGDRPGCGRKRRITEADRSRIIELARCAPPGRLVREPGGELAAEDETAPGEWTLDTLTAAARRQGIAIQRSQVRRILRAEGARWRRTHSWATSRDPQFAPKERRSSASTPTRRRAPR
jgi:transposase